MIIHDVEQRSPEWYALRAGIPTASNFSKVVTSAGEVSKQRDAYALTLAAEQYAGTLIDDFSTAYMERGLELEDQALRAYAFMVDADPQRVGFVTDDQKRWGCSPDALIGDDGMVEVKCLKTENHVAALLRYEDKGDAPPTYYQQTQGQMMVAERQWCDLIFYHPSLPMVIVRDTPHEIFQGKLVESLLALQAERERIALKLSTFRTAA